MMETAIQKERGGFGSFNKGRNRKDRNQERKRRRNKFLVLPTEEIAVIILEGRHDI
jgi:hypothetical protein